MKKISFTALPLTIALLMALGSPAQADPPPSNFGEHVSTCAHTMGLGADMNPGRMHHVASGWSEMSC